MPALPVGKVKL